MRKAEKCGELRRGQQGVPEGARLDLSGAASGLREASRFPFQALKMGGGESKLPREG